MESNDSTDGTSFDSSEISLSRSIRFWLLLLLDIPSVVCSFLLLYHLFHDRTLLKALNNHVIIILLIFNLGSLVIDVPLYLVFILNSGIVQPTTPTTCLIWWTSSFGMYNGGTILMAWAAIERHILVFKYQWIATRKRRFFSHYLPLLILLLYIIIYYTYALYFFPCENAYEYTLPQCNAYPCYQGDPILGVYDFSMNNVVPSLLVAFMSMALLLRVVQHKRRLNQHVQWRKQRKMTIQLVAISMLNILFNIPLNLVSLAHLCGLPEDYGVEAQQYFYFSCYFLNFFFPFVCLFSYPELISKVQWKLLYRKIRPNNAIAPSVWATHRHS